LSAWVSELGVGYFALAEKSLPTFFGRAFLEEGYAGFLAAAYAFNGTEKPSAVPRCGVFWAQSRHSSLQSASVAVVRRGKRLAHVSGRFGLSGWSNKDPGQYLESANVSHAGGLSIAVMMQRTTLNRPQSP